MKSTTSAIKWTAFIGCMQFLLACATLDERFANQEDIQHPAMQVFLAYKEVAQANDDFNDEVKAFFSEVGQKRIEQTMGWHRLVFSASHRALSNGDCEQISIDSQSVNHVLISCKGPYTFKSAFGLKSEETMHLRVDVRKIKGEWHIDTSGLTHTMQGGESVPRSIGRKYQ